MAPSRLFQTVIFNIGGTIFETHRSTLRKLPQSPLADESFLRKHFREDKGHYFFDRDPEVFGAILNYLRTGELHLPTKYCGPAVKVIQRVCLPTIVGLFFVFLVERSVQKYCGPVFKVCLPTNCSGFFV